MKVLKFLRELAELARPDRKSLWLLIGLTAFGEMSTLPGPFLLAWLIGRMKDEVLLAELAAFCLIVLALHLLQGGIGLLRVRFNRRFTLNAANRMRKNFFEHLLHLPYSHFLEQSAGSQASSFLNDINDIDRAVSELVEIGLKCSLLILFYGAALMLWNPWLGLLSLVLLPLTILAQHRLGENARRSSREKVDIRKTLLGDVSEAVANVSVLKSFTMERMSLDHLGRISAGFRDEEVRLETYNSLMRSSTAVLLAFTQYTFFIFGGWMVMIGRLGLGPYLGQLHLVSRLNQPAHALLRYFHQLNQSQAALSRVREMMEQAREGTLHQRPVKKIPHLPAGVELAVEDLHFQYTDDLPLIQGWNFRVEPGQTVAVIGPSGSGKTTLFHLLLGLFDDYSGSIHLNGINLQEVELQALRAKIGVVFQEHILFNASLRKNLLIGVPENHPAEDEGLWHALKLAQADGFARELQDGLDTLIGVNGVALSGGQRQRIALARVILKNPPLLLLDEATSALDSISETQVQEALQTLFRNRTSLVIAHRLSTITKADNILVVDEGQIIEQGTHTTLIDQNGIYSRLYEAQVSGFIDWSKS
ncbi:MAG: ABC transporter ATP-binding protein [Planctomycetota bacterium]|jgi:ABC-type multidrug transport system fused ATPase/permease subunit|nr:ABC transporter ATP-binding protein [Planctomycetota bacterium]